MKKNFYLALLCQCGIVLGASNTKKGLFEIARCKTIQNKLLSEALKKKTGENSKLSSTICSLTKELQTQKDLFQRREKFFNDVFQEILLGLETINKNFEAQEEFKKQMDALLKLLKKEDEIKK
ncbi:MAG: hypothetical protein UV79_C0006G0013 [candidate division TM6 bacterium GW2011_GWF2_43_17]|nr:MAG: hypothetical protein UV79_C0006G0013 [candidate division TM6 bacterium GW2011_GWF2_43_17]HAU30322.1 hypothetical protein [Candidatus Dependentiae bacterium]